MSNIIVSAVQIKYSHIDYFDNYVVITQNRTIRRVYSGFYFYDNGSEIYVSTTCVGMFQHRKKIKRFILNTETKEWNDYETITVERHFPDKILPIESNQINSLKK